MSNVNTQVYTNVSSNQRSYPEMTKFFWKKTIGRQIGWQVKNGSG
jgi:hypothetical protein